MHTLLLFLWCFVNPIERPIVLSSDTCHLRQIPIDCPFREITWYTTYYDAFRKNDTSDYQLICISVPFDDASGNVLYYKTNNNVSESEVGAGTNIKHKLFSPEESSLLCRKLEKVERGGYVCICDLDATNVVYSICIVKKKEEVIFQYQGLNKNMLNLKDKDAEKLKNVIQLVRSLRK